MGNTGTGKSNFIKTLKFRERRKVIISDDYPDNNSLDLLKDISRAIDEGKVIILEGVFMLPRNRTFLINEIRPYHPNTHFICFDFGPGNNDSLNYRIENSPLSKQEVIEIHNRNQAAYEEPKYREGFNTIFRCYKSSEIEYDSYQNDISLPNPATFVFPGYFSHPAPLNR